MASCTGHMPPKRRANQRADDVTPVVGNSYSWFGTRTPSKCCVSSMKTTITLLRLDRAGWRDAVVCSLHKFDEAVAGGVDLIKF
jgi:hypothetical protein